MDVTVDRTGWPAGQWDHESDEHRWAERFADRIYTCWLRRHPIGHWCGYVAVDPDHPWCGEEFRNFDAHINVHGGISFSGEMDGAWRIGFDCGHANVDLIPGMIEIQQRINARTAEFLARHNLPDELSRLWTPVYRTSDYAMRETTGLARQLHEVHWLANALTEMVKEEDEVRPGRSDEVAADEDRNL